MTSLKPIAEGDRRVANWNDTAFETAKDQEAQECPTIPDTTRCSSR